MTKILGLDLGTNSIGWAIVQQERNGKLISTNLLDKGVHIFSEGVKIEKGNESSRAAERTQYRSARKIKFRRRLRKQKTLEALIKNKMCPLTMGELEAWRLNKKSYPENPDFRFWLSTDENSNKNPYFFRSEASKKKVELYDLGRAFYHIAQRRGFLSNRLEKGDKDVLDTISQEIKRIIETENNNEDLVNSLNELLLDYTDDEDKNIKRIAKSIEKIIQEKDESVDSLKKKVVDLLNKAENLGVVKKSISVLSKEMKLNNCDTLSQYFYHLFSLDRNDSKNKIRKRYTAREDHYLDEFNKICAVQKLQPSVCDQLQKAIFYQRPLKSQKGLVGKCSFEKNKPRCSVSHPDFEEFRALQFINSIKASNDHGELVFLTKEERESIWPKFLRKSKPNFDFEDISKQLGAHRFFNYKNNATVSGCPTIAQLSNLFGENWKKNITEKYTRKKSKNGNKSTEEIINDVWHVLFTFDKESKLQEFAEQRLALNKTEAVKFSKIILKSEYSNLSLKAINKILPYLREGLIYSYAVFLANIDEVVGKEVWNADQNSLIIRREIKSIIDNYAEDIKREGIVNNLVASFRENYNNAGKGYNLDEEDKKEVKEKILSVYGSKHFERLEIEKQSEIIGDIENKYLQQLRKGHQAAFIKRQRLDERISTFLSDHFDVEQEMLSKLYHPSDIEMFKQPARSEDGKLFLGSPVVASIKNPMAMRTMHQLRKLVNTLIKESRIDEETKIHIELARELNDSNKRKAIQRWQKERKDNKDRYVKEIKQLYKEECGKDIEPNDDEILKYQLWEEQQNGSHICIYTGKTIGICDFIGADPKFDIEHTIPRSLGFDNSQENLTLCDVKFNRDVKSNKIPSELANHKEIVLRLGKWSKKIEEFEKLYAVRKKPRSIETKEQKDKRISEKHYFKLNLDYWKGKYSRFTREDVPEGFKNSQIVDTGIITKYARMYLKSIFPQVYSVKGIAVAEFRKQWGLQENYTKKSRSNHIHHCIDAITIACMTKDKYDFLAKLYKNEEENKLNDKKEILKQMKPWPSFTEDVKAIEQDVLVSHYTPNNLEKKAKKKQRVRGKIGYTKSGDVIFKKGDVARGALHKETFYGAILKADYDSKTGKKIVDENGKVQRSIQYVVRKELSKLEEKDVRNIVDPIIKQKVQAAIDEFGFKKATQNVLWMNEEKKVEIKKVRLLVPTIADPIVLKTHRDSSKYNHKRDYYVTNESNYLMAIYEGVDGKGKKKRDFELVNTLEAVKYFKTSNDLNQQYPVVPEKKYYNKGLKDEFSISLQIRNKKPVCLKIGDLVLLKQDSKEIINWSDKSELNKRLFKIKGLSHSLIQDKYDYGVIILLHNNEARPVSTMKMADGDFILNDGKTYRKLNHNQFEALINGIDFKLSETGTIIPLDNA